MKNARGILEVPPGVVGRESAQLAREGDIHLLEALDIGVATLRHDAAQTAGEVVPTPGTGARAVEDGLQARAVVAEVLHNILGRNRVVEAPAEAESTEIDVQRSPGFLHQ